MLSVVVLFFCLVLCHGKNLTQESPVPTDLHNVFTEKIGNFSVELLYHTAKSQNKDINMVLSPITVWSVMVVIAEGASGATLDQINFALRTPRNKTSTRSSFKDVAQWLRVNTTTVELSKVNAIFADIEKLPEKDFLDLAKNYYDTDLVPLDFKQNNVADLINQGVSKFTHGRIPKLVDSNDFSDTQMILTSAVYFKAQWSVPFNSTFTSKQPFYDSKGQQIGDVNMMYNRYPYPFANIKALQARVIELPYGMESRLSMLILVPYSGVSLEDMFLNFKNVPLDTVFEELRRAREEFAEDEVDCYIPRFKITSEFDLTNVLKRFGIEDLFDASKARLPLMARLPLYVSKVTHKADIEVTEEGTTASAVTAAEFANRIGAVQFTVNRPFTYLIIERITNTIVFGGFYQLPSLY